MQSDTPHPVPDDILNAAHFTLYFALIFARNYSAQKDAPQDVIYDLMDAIHEIPQILMRWGISDNDVSKLKLYFSCFNYEKWKGTSEHFNPPDLVQIFEDALQNPQ